MNNIKRDIDSDLLAERFDDLLLKAASDPEGKAFIPTAYQREVTGWSPELRKGLEKIATEGARAHSKVQAIFHRIEDLGRKVQLKRAKGPYGEMGVLVTKIANEKPFPYSFGVGAPLIRPLLWPLL